MLQVDEYGSAKLPPKATRVYAGLKRPGVTIGHYVDERTGAVETVHFIIPDPVVRSGSDGGEVAPEPKARGPITGTGVTMIGNMRTDALHAALHDQPIDDGQLIGLLVLALGGRNVEVKSGLAGAGIGTPMPRDIAATLTEGGVLTTDTGLLRTAARAVLAYTLSCRDNWSCSGEVALVAGSAIAADAHLPAMANQDFLMCLSKAELSRVAADLGVVVQPTAKATRGRMIDLVGDGRWIYPLALFPTGAATACQERPREDHQGAAPAASPDASLDEGNSHPGQGGSMDGASGDAADEDLLDDGIHDPGLPPAAWIAPSGADGSAAAA